MIPTTSWPDPYICLVQIILTNCIIVFNLNFSVEKYEWFSVSKLLGLINAESYLELLYFCCLTGRMRRSCICLIKWLLVLYNWRRGSSKLYLALFVQLGLDTGFRVLLWVFLNFECFTLWYIKRRKHYSYQWELVRLVSTKMILISE